jgi:hypothetical protein
MIPEFISNEQPGERSDSETNVETSDEPVVQVDEPEEAETS